MRHDLRDYQTKSIADIEVALTRCRAACYVAPTGAGKTTVAVEIVERAKLQTLWLAHREELIVQAARRFAINGISVGIIKAGYPPDPMKRIQVASKDTLNRRYKPYAELVVFDEAHHAVSKTNRAIINVYPDAKILGLTATPFRLDGRGLGEVFEELVLGPSVRELCDSGTLHAPKVFAGKLTPDLKGIKVARGDFQIDLLAERMNDARLIGDIIETWKQRAAGRRTIVFAVNIAHSKAIVEAFVADGIPAEHVDGFTDDRSGTLGRLDRHETTLVSNCMVYTEGTDLPKLECAIVARPTASLNLHLQCIGRIMRTAEGKDGAIVLDHAGNHYRHGFVTDEIEYSLESQTKFVNTRRGQTSQAKEFECKGCGMLLALGTSECAACGWVNHPGTEGPGELQELTSEDRAEAWAAEQAAWLEIETKRLRLGMQPGWSWYRFKDQFGHAPVCVGDEKEVRRLIDPSSATRAEKREVYRDLLRRTRGKGHKDGAANHRYKAIFGVWPSGFVEQVKREVSTDGAPLCQAMTPASA